MSNARYVQFETGEVFDNRLRHEHPNSKAITREDYKRLYRENSINRLRLMLTPGDTVYTLVNHASSTGMSRSIKLFAIVENDIRDLSFTASIALDWPMHTKGGIKVNGGMRSMDMAFHTVYTLASILYPAANGQDSYEDKTGRYSLKNRSL